MSARIFPRNEPLTDAELGRLGEFLKRCKAGEAMNLEELDGSTHRLPFGLQIRWMYQPAP
jgi:hypothetical protein